MTTRKEDHPDEPEGVVDPEPLRHVWDVFEPPGRPLVPLGNDGDPAPPARVRPSVLRTIGFELSAASGLEPAGLVRGTVLGAVGMTGGLLALLMLGVAARVEAAPAAISAAFVLAAFLVVTLLGYRRSRRPTGGA